MFKPARGAYPTMITPYNSDGSIDYGAVKALTEWYFENDMAGIFAVCQSSEIHMLSLTERVQLAHTVRETADALAKTANRPPMTIVASGHISDSFDAQREELCAVAETGIDSLILISNRFDIENTGEDAWCTELDRMLEALPDIPLGIYECPRPYKRLLTEKMIAHVTGTGRFAFIKDTCCDRLEIARRVRWIEDTPSPAMKPALFNANAQTLLDTLRAGAAGYCGVMCNFHPALYAELCRVYKTEPEYAELLAALLSQAAFIEYIDYPSIAKYHLDKIGIRMSAASRTSREVTDYDKMCVDRMDLLIETAAPLLRSRA